MRTDKPYVFAQPLFAGRKILWFGCAFILIVMCLSTADLTYSLRKTAGRSDAVISAFRERSRMLDQLRSLMLRSALSPESSDDRAIATQDLPGAHLRANHILAQFEASLEASGDQATQQRLVDLRLATNRCWESLPAVRDDNTRHPQAMSAPFAASPGRKQIRRIARQIMDLNREQQDRAEAQLHTEHVRLQEELLVSSSLSVLVVLVLIGAMAYRIRNTERLAEKQYLHVVQARSELQTFAGRLEQAQEDERRTLSRELHDEFGQTMAAALVELSHIENEMTEDNGTRAQLARVKRELESSMRSIRDIALLLRPSMLDDLGLVPALRWQGREVARRSGLAVRVEAEDDGKFLPDNYRTCIYRVVQEALHNIVKHAFAKVAVVTFCWTKQVLDLTIADDGKGFCPSSEKGMGLLGIEERVGRLAGHLNIASSPGQGTTLHVTLPVPAEEKEAVSR